VGEASHPGPSNPILSTTVFAAIASIVAAQCIVLSLCDGMGCGALALGACNARFDRYIGVELEQHARSVGQAANPRSPSFCGIDHNWHSDLLNITEQDIVDLGPGNVKLFIFGAPCEDMSKLRLINPHNKGNGDPRPGLDGPKGCVFRHCIHVLKWVLLHNPDCEYLAENVEFSGMPEHWDEVNKALGSPIIINAADYSYTKRNRAYWSNFVDRFKTHGGRAA
jgi:hypothetical protein